MSDVCGLEKLLGKDWWNHPDIEHKRRVWVGVAIQEAVAGERKRILDGLKKLVGEGYCRHHFDEWSECKNKTIKGIDGCWEKKHPTAPYCFACKGEMVIKSKHVYAVDYKDVESLVSGGKPVDSQGRSTTKLESVDSQTKTSQKI